MKKQSAHTIIFSSVLMVVLCSTQYASAVPVMLSCENMQSIDTPAPDYPSLDLARSYLSGTAYAHHSVSGYVEVEYTVNKDGRVADIRVIDSKEIVSPKMVDQKSFKGFFEISVIPTLSNWRYAVLEKPCRTKMRFSFQPV